MSGGIKLGANGVTIGANQEPLVTLDVSPGTDAVALAAGNTAQRPSPENTVPGEIRFNSQLDQFEGTKNDENWYPIGGGVLVQNSNITVNTATTLDLISGPNVIIKMTDDYPNNRVQVVIDSIKGNSNGGGGGNSGSYQVDIYANGNLILANAALDVINTSTVNVTTALANSNSTVNVGFNANVTAIAGPAFNQANAAYAQANLAYTEANTAAAAAAAALVVADDAYAEANLAAAEAATANALAQSAFTQANSAYAEANTANAQANLAYAAANLAANAVSVYHDGNLVLARANLNFNDSANINVFVTANGTTQANIELSLNGSVIIANTVEGVIATGSNQNNAFFVPANNNELIEVIAAPLFIVSTGTTNVDMTAANYPGGADPLQWYGYYLGIFGSESPTSANGIGIIGIYEADTSGTPTNITLAVNSNNITLIEQSLAFMQFIDVLGNTQQYFLSSGSYALDTGLGGTMSVGNTLVQWPLTETVYNQLYDASNGHFFSGNVLFSLGENEYVPGITLPPLLQGQEYTVFNQDPNGNTFNVYPSGNDQIDFAGNSQPFSMQSFDEITFYAANANSYYTSNTVVPQPYQVDVYYDGNEIAGDVSVDFLDSNTITWTVDSNGALVDISATANITVIAGPAYDQANAAYAQANVANALAQSAYTEANTAAAAAAAALVIADDAYAEANTANAQANLAYTQANTANGIAQSAYSEANTANALAQSAYTAANAAANLVAVYLNGTLVQANSNLNFNTSATVNAAAVANGATQVNVSFNANVTAIAGPAYAQANAAYSEANTANAQANLAYTQANNAYAEANTANTLAQSAYTEANTANAVAQAASTQANSAYAQANAAYTAANAAGNTVVVYESGTLVIANAGLNLINTQSINLVAQANGVNANITATINTNLNLTSLNVTSNIAAGNLAVTSRANIGLSLNVGTSIVDQGWLQIQGSLPGIGSINLSGGAITMGNENSGNDQAIEIFVANAGVDQGWWEQIATNTGHLVFRTANDQYANIVNWMLVTRDGSNVATITLGNPNDLPPIYMNGSANIQSTLNVVGNSAFTQVNASSVINASALVVTHNATIQGNLTVVYGANIANLVGSGNTSNITVTQAANGEYLIDYILGQPGGGGSTPGGANTDIQFNSNGTFGGSPNLTFNLSTNTTNILSANIPTLVAGQIIATAPPGIIAGDFIGANGLYAVDVNGSANTGNSLGQIINAGTNVNDIAFRIRNQNAGCTFVTVDGTGVVTIGGPATTSNVTGNCTLNTAALSYAFGRAVLVMQGQGANDGGYIAWQNTANFIGGYLYGANNEMRVYGNTIINFEVGNITSLTRAMVIDANGIIGVGNTNPSAVGFGNQFIIQNVATRMVLVCTGNANNSGYRYQIQNTAGNVQSLGIYGAPSDTGKNQFIGIAADDANYQLQVSANANVYTGANLSVGVAQGANNWLLLNAENGTQMLLQSIGADFGAIGNPTSQVWCLGATPTQSNAMPTVNVLTWTATGNVGIGNQLAPQTTLDVNGAARAWTHQDHYANTGLPATFSNSASVLASNNCTVYPNGTIVATDTATANWDAYAYGWQMSSGMIRAQQTQNTGAGMMVGFTQQPTTMLAGGANANQTYVALDFALYYAIGIFNVYENGVDVATFGGYTAANGGAVMYDGNNVTYFANTYASGWIPIRTVNRPGLTLTPAYAGIASRAGNIAANCFLTAIQTIDTTLAGYNDITLANNILITLSNSAPTGNVSTVTLLLRQTAQTNCGVAFANTIKWSDGHLPGLSAGPNTADMITLVTYNGGNFWIGSQVMGNVPSMNVY